MRRSSPLTPYTRAAMFSKASKEELGASLLANLAAGEYRFIRLLVDNSGVLDAGHQVPGPGTESGS